MATRPAESAQALCRNGARAVLRRAWRDSEGDACATRKKPSRPCCRDRRGNDGALLHRAGKRSLSGAPIPEPSESVAARGERPLSARFSRRPEEQTEVDSRACAVTALP